MSDSNSFAYIEVTFSDKTKTNFSDIVKQLVSEDKLYYSKDAGYSHINGDVTEKLHCTLFFGIDPVTINDPKLHKIIDKYDFSDIKLGKLVLINGWQNEYKILCIEVINENNQFTKFAADTQEFVNDENIKYEVKPHLSLAYVQPDYKIPETLPKLPKMIKSEGVKISVFNS